MMNQRRDEEIPETKDSVKVDKVALQTFIQEQAEKSKASEAPASKRRRGIIALLLSFVTPGLGQIYNGQIRKAIILYLAGLLLGLILSLLSVVSFYGLIFCLTIAICFRLFIVFEAFYSSRKLKQIVLRRYNKWYFYIIIVLISAFVIRPLYSALIKNNIVQAYRIPSSAMEPTLLVGDHILVNKSIYGIRIPYIGKKFLTFHKPKRGDIIVFLYPEDPRKDFIKRVIATEGEEVQIKNRKIFINGMAIEDPWGVYGDRTGLLVPSHFRPRDNYGPRTVPPNSLFVLGDNRDNSQDSRYWGFVDLSAVKGKAFIIYFSYHKRAINLLDKVRWNRFGLLVR